MLWEAKCTVERWGWVVAYADSIIDWVEQRGAAA